MKKNVKRIIATMLAVIIVSGVAISPAHADEYSDLMNKLPNFSTVMEESVEGSGVLEALNKVAQGDMAYGPSYTEEQVYEIGQQFESKAVSVAEDLDESLGLLLQAEENDDDRTAEEICEAPFARIAQTLADMWEMLCNLLNGVYTPVE